MNERRLRQVHGALGVILSLFVLVQVGSGTIIALSGVVGETAHTHSEVGHDHHHEEPADRHVQNLDPTIFQIIHHYGATEVQALRTLLGIGIIGMVVTGCTIYLTVYRRKKKVSNQAL